MIDWIKKLFCTHNYMPLFYARNKFGMTCPKCNKNRKPNAFEIFMHAKPALTRLEEIQGMTPQEQVDLCARLDAKLAAVDAGTDWPESEDRIDIIGSNGNDGYE